MDHTGIRILFEGSNGLRLLSGLWTTVEISLLSVIGSVIFGLFTGLFMTLQNRAAKLISRFYLEFIRIMPQLVLLFIAYFGITRALDQPVRICRFCHRFHLMGNGRNGRSRQRRAHLYP